MWQILWKILSFVSSTVYVPQTHFRHFHKRLLDILLISRIISVRFHAYWSYEMSMKQRNTHLSRYSYNLKLAHTLTPNTDQVIIKVEQDSFISISSVSKRLLFICIFWKRRKSCAIIDKLLCGFTQVFPLHPSSYHGMNFSAAVSAQLV